MKNLLVTGGAGFIGANFVHYWLTNHPSDTVVVLDALTYAGNPANLTEHPKLRFVHGDICDGELVARLLREHHIDWIVHFAAESHVDRSITGPDEFIRTNVIGTHTLLKAAREEWSRGGSMRQDVRFHHVSTDEVYGSLRTGDPAFTERTPYSPNSPYSASKAGSDHLVRAYGHTYGLPVTTSNCSNNYGPYQFPEKLFSLAITNLIEGKKVPVYGDGRQVRDWLHVSDHSKAIDRIIHDGRVGETYCIGGDGECENLHIVQMILGIMGKDDSSVEFVTDRPGHDRRYAMDHGKITQELGWQPEISLEEGLRATVDWYQTNETWWRHVKSGEYQKYYEAQYHKR